MTEQKPPKPPSRVTAVWDGEQRFHANAVGYEQTIKIDGNRHTAPSPVDTLLAALASCSAIDTVEILAKRRTPVESLRIEVIGDRAAATPSRVTRVMLEFHMKGAGIERQHAERAIELSVNKYCSVRDTLDPSMPVEWKLLLNE